MGLGFVTLHTSLCFFDSMRGGGLVIGRFEKIWDGVHCQEKLFGVFVGFFFVAIEKFGFRCELTSSDLQLAYE